MAMVTVDTHAMVWYPGSDARLALGVALISRDGRIRAASFEII